MNIEIVEATLAEKPVLGQLIELYQHDFTEFDDNDVGSDGRFGYDYLDRYWIDEGRKPFLVRVDGELAGFALLKRGGHLVDDPDAVCVSEFFIMRKYRRRGVATEVARRLFDRIPGRWEVAEMRTNTPAQAFWRRVIGEYTGGRFEERTFDDDRWHGPIQFFDSSSRR